jgi:amidase
MRDWKEFLDRQVAEQSSGQESPWRQSLEIPKTGPFPEEFLEASLEELGQLLRARTTSSEELTLGYLGRIAEQNPDLGAYIAINPEVLEEARARDRELREGVDRGPLHGIPICLKDNLATSPPLPTTAGAAALRGALADRDAFLVARLREAGAVILGKNNLSEWANYMSSRSVNGFSALGGYTRNPYGLYDVGGSSSGTAVAVAANLAAAGIGTETSGSLVYPASQNSLYTLKPTLGLLSRDRIIPITEAQDTAGPMARHARDLALLIEVLAVHDPSDPATLRTLHRPTPLPHPLRVGRVAQLEREGDREALDRIEQALKALGAEVREIPPLQGEIEMHPVLRFGLREGVNAYLKATRAPVGSLKEVIDFNRAHPEAMPYGQDLLEASFAEPLSPEGYAAQVAHNRRVGLQALRKAFAEVDVLMTVSNTLSSFTSTAGVPVLCLPAGRRPNGEPVGVSLIDELLTDRALIELAQALEEALPLRQRP